MFGYVTPNEELLSKELMARFRRIYCGVCADLCEKCGARGRFTLTYDAAFLALVLNALYEPQENRKKSLCTVHPLRRQELETGEMTAYAADINIILCYYSLLDGWKDDGNRIKKKGADLLKPAFDAACLRLPEKAETVRCCLERLSGYEKSRSTDIDAAAGCFGTLLGDVFAVKDDLWAPALKRMGDALGRYIYLLDALNDLKKDSKSGSYNVLLPLSSEPDFDSRVYEMLKTEMALCAQAFETLPIVQDIDIIRNVIYSGVWKGYPAKRRPAQTEDTDGTGSI